MSLEEDLLDELFSPSQPFFNLGHHHRHRLCTTTPTESIDFHHTTGSQMTSSVTTPSQETFIDPRHVFFGSNSNNANNTDRPLTTPLMNSSVFANRSVELASTPTSLTDTPKFSVVDFPAQPQESTPPSSSNLNHSSTDSSSSSCSQATLEERGPFNISSRTPIRSHRSSTLPVSVLKGSKGKSRSSTNAAMRSSTGPHACDPHRPRTIKSHSTGPLSNNSTTSTSTPAPRRTRLQLPLTLPTPHFNPACTATDPYRDVSEHLARIGLDAEAEDAARNGWTAGYALGQVRRMLGGGEGEEELWRLALSRPEEMASLCASVVAAAQSKTMRLVKQHPSETSSGPTLHPSHVLAVLPSPPSASTLAAAPPNVLAQMGLNDIKSAGGNSGREEHLRPTLFPIHSMVYALQCRGLPDGCFDRAKNPPEVEASEMDGQPIVVRVVRLRVPRPSTFGITHEFLCTGSTQRFLAALVPLKYINETIRSRNNAAPPPAPPTSNEPTTLTFREQAIQALADLPQRQLLKLAGTISSVYANGCALGLMELGYWRTLGTSWELVVGGLAVRRGRGAAAASAAAMEVVGKEEEGEGEVRVVRRAMGGLGLEVAGGEGQQTGS
ncbi:hypothetical protein V8E36_009328 [Tilletia maclaganii]